MLDARNLAYSHEGVSCRARASRPFCRDRGWVLNLSYRGAVRFDDHDAIGVDTHARSGGSIYTFAPDGSHLTRVIVGGSSPSWSPDGSQIAYTIQCDQDPTFTCAQFDPQAGLSPAGLAIADADGSNIREFGFAASGPWHPGLDGGE